MSDITETSYTTSSIGVRFVQKMNRRSKDLNHLQTVTYYLLLLYLKKRISRDYKNKNAVASRRHKLMTGHAHFDHVTTKAIHFQMYRCA